MSMHDFELLKNYLNSKRGKDLSQEDIVRIEHEYAQAIRQLQLDQRLHNHQQLYKFYEYYFKQIADEATERLNEAQEAFKRLSTENPADETFGVILQADSDLPPFELKRKAIKNEEYWYYETQNNQIITFTSKTESITLRYRAEEKPVFNIEGRSYEPHVEGKDGLWTVTIDAKDLRPTDTNNRTLRELGITKACVIRTSGSSEPEPRQDRVAKLTMLDSGERDVVIEFSRQRQVQKSNFEAFERKQAHLADQREKTIDIPEGAKSMRVVNASIENAQRILDDETPESCEIYNNTLQGGGVINLRPSTIKVFKLTFRFSNRETGIEVSAKLSTGSLVNVTLACQAFDATNNQIGKPEQQQIAPDGTSKTQFSIISSAQYYLIKVNPGSIQEVRALTNYSRGKPQNSNNVQRKSESMVALLGKSRENYPLEHAELAITINPPEGNGGDSENSTTNTTIIKHRKEMGKAVHNYVKDLQKEIEDYSRETLWKWESRKANQDHQKITQLMSDAKNKEYIDKQITNMVNSLKQVPQTNGYAGYFGDMLKHFFYGIQGPNIKDKKINIDMMNTALKRFIELSDIKNYGGQ